MRPGFTADFVLLGPHGFDHGIQFAATSIVFDKLVEIEFDIFSPGAINEGLGVIAEGLEVDHGGILSRTVVWGGSPAEFVEEDSPEGGIGIGDEADFSGMATDGDAVTGSEG